MRRGLMGGFLSAIIEYKFRFLFLLFHNYMYSEAFENLSASLMFHRALCTRKPIIKGAYSN